MKNTNWKLIGLISTILLIILSLFQVIDWFSNNRSKIKATFIMDDYYIPKSIEKRYNYNEFLKIDDTISNLISQHLQNNESKSLTDTISRIINKHFNHGFFNSPLNHFNIVEINIKSNSKKTVKGINLEIDTEGICQIYNQENKVKDFYLDHITNLEDLRPENSYKIIIWSSDYLTCRDAKISYDGGYIKPKEMRKISGYLLFLDTFGKMFYIVIPLFIILLWLQLNINKPENINDLKIKNQKK